MINAGTLPVEGAREDLAAAALDVFLSDVRARAAEFDEVPIRHRVAELVGDPVRDPAADRDGRYGWDLPFSDGRIVRLLMPGVAVHDMLGDVTAASACLYVNGTAWWWPDAVAMVAGEGIVLRQAT